MDVLVPLISSQHMDYVCQNITPHPREGMQRLHANLKIAPTKCWLYPVYSSLPLSPKGKKGKRKASPGTHQLPFDPKAAEHFLALTDYYHIHCAHCGLKRQEKKGRLRHLTALVLYTPDQQET